MKSCILKHSFSAAAIGIPGAFAAHADIPALAGIWGRMIYKLAKHADCGMDEKTALKAAGSIAASVATMAAGAKLANTYFAATGIGTPIAIAANAGANAAGTWIVGNIAGELMLEDDIHDLASKVLIQLSRFFIGPKNDFS